MAMARTGLKGHSFLKNSASFPAPGPQAPSGAPPRKSFALSGPTVSLDPRHNAVRPDLADIRLAEYVFAPHYAAPFAMKLRMSATVREAPGEKGATVTTLEAAAIFDVLDVAGRYAWGVCQASGLVGYVDHAALEPIVPTT